MAKIATLVYYCSRCDRYSTDADHTCSVCGNELEARALINVEEMRMVMQKLQTPEGIVNLMESFKTWVDH